MYLICLCNFCTSSQFNYPSNTLKRLRTDKEEMTEKKFAFPTIGPFFVILAPTAETDEWKAWLIF